MTAIVAKTGDWLILALTPVERWQAARKLDNTYALPQWLYLVLIVTMLVFAGLCVIFIIKCHIKRKEERGDNFVEQAHKKGITEREGTDKITE